MLDKHVLNSLETAKNRLKKGIISSIIKEIRFIIDNFDEIERRETPGLSQHLDGSQL